MLRSIIRYVSKTQGPLNVTVTGGSGQIAYNLLFHLASGAVFGPTTPIILRVHDLHSKKSLLNGVRMELHDCAFPLLQDIIITDNYSEAFLEADYAFLVGAKPLKEGMNRFDLIRENGEIFISVGHAISKYSKKSIKVLVIGNPVNTNCLIAMAHAHGVPKQNFSAMTRLQHNRMVYQLASHFKVPLADINNVGIWGNSSPTMYPDITHLHIKTSPVVFDQNWYENEFIPLIQNRSAQILKMRKHSSAASTATAAADQMRDWVFGSHHKWVSMGVSTDLFHGEFNIPKGLVFSYPVICTHESFHIIKHTHHDRFCLTRLQITVDELLREKSLVEDFLKDS